MKKTITYKLCFFITLCMLIIIVLCYYFQVKQQREWLYTNFAIRIEQISQRLDENTTEIERLRENLEEDYLIRAKAATYIVQNYPEVIGNQQELEKIASLLQIDEIHLFDTDGVIYAGSEPKYFGYAFTSGQQMQFFLPMLDDFSLELCQDIQPNTAEGKMMQYIAVWREDHQGIVQIGMEPIRLMEAMKKNEVSHVFSMMTVEKGVTIFIADLQTGDILGATDDILMGKKLEHLGINLTDMGQREKQATIIDTGQSYSVVEIKDDILIGVSSTREYLYQDVTQNMVLLVFSLCVLSVVVILLIMNMLDRVVINGIYKLIDSIKSISDGNLDQHVEVADTPEFIELSTSINSMVMSLLQTTSKLSLVFKNVNIPIAAYEYNQDMNRVLATSQIGDILMLPESEINNILLNRERFIEKIEQARSCTFDLENNIYLFGDELKRYLKIKCYEEENRTLGVIIDVTEETLEKQQVEFERDIDFLTGLSSRRAFYSRLEQIYNQPKIMKTAVILIADLDNLKRMNDTWGHERGDKLLQKAANVLKNCEAQHKIAARLGGDEFVLMIYGADSQEELMNHIDNVHLQLANTGVHVPNGEMISISMSGGYIFSSDFVADYCIVLRLVDQTMYKAKKEKKGHFIQYDSSII